MNNGYGLPLGAVFRRLVNGTDRNDCTPLHVAIIHAHPACVSALLRAHASPSKLCDGGTPLALATCLGLSACEERAAAGMEIVRALLAAGADPYDKYVRACMCFSDQTRRRCMCIRGAAEVQRSRVAAMMADVAALAAADEGGGGGGGGASLPGMLLSGVERAEHVLAAADHDGFTPLHLAAKFGHPEVVAQLLTAAEESAAAAAATGEELAAAAAAKAAAAALAEGSGSETAAAAVLPPLSAATLAALIPVADPLPLLKAKTKQEGHTALHLAAMYGRTAAAVALMRALAAVTACGGAQVMVAALTAADKKGRTAADLARRRGHPALADLLTEAAAAKAVPDAAAAVPAMTTMTLGADGGAAAADGRGCRRTLLLAPAECLLHRTAPEPIERSDAEPPPENVNRLHVLTQPATGILHNLEFSDLEWRTSGIPQAAMVDVLRCHDWSYVRRVIQACEAITDVPSCVGFLDHDTAISHHTMRAALVAAGAVCTAVDEVVAGKARNAFCAVRPPGHHAGPCGIVTNPNDSHGSHGFCILSNVAIGGAYAMAVHRHAGIRRVAIVDFDVHHGNGTQACVLNTVPSIRTLSLRTPYSDGQQHFPVYKPWLGDNDEHNILFASPGGKPRMWRRAWRDKILPAVVNFKPDIIFVSAGFDAHKKEDLNLRYVGVTEADYEWLTGQIVEVANVCCDGRVVSVLEGGYNLRGGPLGSAFARSVAAHVRALQAPCTAKYDPLDAETERAAEKALEARKAAKAAALAAGIIPPAGLVTPRSSIPTPRAFPPVIAATAAGGGGLAPMDTDPNIAGPHASAAAPAAADANANADSAAGPPGGEEPPSKRRRRPVDYAALNAQLEKEQQEAAAAAEAGGKAETAAVDEDGAAGGGSGR
ncbi:hypothetical protein VOLCADRAFT_118904 [Volvox carteri f. nagariensis]|uniref:Histone deacetylase domain-containing protein n=1 Tax=Volvox carteri f. nagariensis TaxID=3068 RepID=D8U8H3_VOLCA|nr:uncharacterized protein VOLCADRAFT_118904 [Volvox carteri f. nagariensis]EFJ43924.1 hypothetical protein VOLCADRAFT_118904 [Volvox carteri f. nagariensis]|eukprot:XP_002954936.1 hypothetical protein VOLCADRAFT_118904 [Volvox carteri f. nagariensis]